jgi:hypothetical protein
MTDFENQLWGFTDAEGNVIPGSGGTFEPDIHAGDDTGLLGEPDLSGFGGGLFDKLTAKLGKLFDFVQDETKKAQLTFIAGLVVTVAGLVVVFYIVKAWKK